MKVFLSWSGELSHAAACVFRDWLPSVIQTIHPYVSSEDIDKGARWASDIATELEESSFGILFITQDNVEAPWINFEAGALSKTVDKSRVSPFLFNIKRSEIKEGPLLQFQSTIYEKDDVEKLLLSMNNCMNVEDRLDDTLLKKSVTVWWPELEKQLNLISDKLPVEPKEENGGKSTADASILEELLELARTQQRLLQSPEILLPQEYLAGAMKKTNIPFDLVLFRQAVSKMAARIMELQEYITVCDLSSVDDDNIIINEVRRLEADILLIAAECDVPVRKRMRNNARNVDKCIAADDATAAAISKRLFDGVVDPKTS